MEDTYCHMDKVSGDPSCGFFGVFDGHGGRMVAEHCAETAIPEFRKELTTQPADLYQALESVFARLDKQVSMMDSEHTGSTACVAVARREANHNVVYIANAGDTRAVLSKGGQAQRLSVDHKATDPQEIERVKSVGGSIMDGRVAGGLAVTRAIGDHAYKNFGVTGQPHIVRHVLRPMDKYLIMASDGVWDTVSDQQAVECCRDELNTK
jgi:serine/threonine protein phosphatase PrpC